MATERIDLSLQDGAKTGRIAEYFSEAYETFLREQLEERKGRGIAKSFLG